MLEGTSSAFNVNLVASSFNTVIRSAAKNLCLVGRDPSLPLRVSNSGRCGYARATLLQPTFNARVAGLTNRPDTV